ncbi:MAG: universal stress protein [Gammaproteobacteria bacterium]|nr:MAG: universal stress protein [Gammaproteobacteria bacterium]
MGDYTHILVAVDFTESAEKILVKARDIAQRNHAKLSMLHVVEYMYPVDYVNDPVASNWVVDDVEILENAKKSLQEFSTKHNLKNVDLNVQFGRPKHVISEFVRDQHCDLVIIGSHGRHGLSLLLGSTASAVLHAMPCDILTVKIEE